MNYSSHYNNYSYLIKNYKLVLRCVMRCKGYRLRNWSQQAQLKTWLKLFAFYFRTYIFERGMNIYLPLVAMGKYNSKLRVLPYSGNLSRRKCLND